MTKVDLNADVGESFGNYKIGNDKEIIRLISSANIACGFHAGDPMVMEKTLSYVKESGISFGAHPGFPDLMGFGRRYMDLTDDEIRTYIHYQLSALDGMAKVQGLKMNHIKPHGALYNSTFKDPHMAEVIAEAIKEYNPDLVLVGLANSNLVKAGEEIGLRVANEVFADRAYEKDGSLRSRKKEGAMITDSDLAVKRVIRMVKEGKVETYDGTDIDIKADTICVHGDGAKALEFVRKIRQALTENDIRIEAL